MFESNCPITCSGTWSWLIKDTQSQIQSPLGAKRENKENEKTDKLTQFKFCKEGRGDLLT